MNNMNRNAMQRFWVKRKRTVGAAALLLLCYLLLRPKKYDYMASITIPNIHPSDAWEFVADFSNMRYLNPTITGFNVLSESGNYEHWKYSVEYTEKLSHWPYLSNIAVGHYDVRSLTRQNLYFVTSSHKTCFLLGMLCLNSASEFTFTGKHSRLGVECEEVVQYECPILMAASCEREVAFQRSAIMSNLKKHFAIKTSH